MRVAHVSAFAPDPDAPNGVAAGLYHLSRSLASAGLEVAVFALTAERPLPAIPGVDLRYMGPCFSPLRAPSRLLRDIVAWRPNVLHLHLPYAPGNAALARWARDVGLPYVCLPHGALSPGEMQHRGFLKFPYKYLFELPTLNGAAFVQALSDTEELARYGVCAPIVTVPNGIDVSTLPRDLDSRTLAQWLPALDGRRVFLYVGRLDPDQKGLDLLVDAFLESALEGAALVLVGPEWRGGRRRLERRLAGARTAPLVFLPGPAYGRQKFDYLAGADVFVHPSRWEGMPQAVLEAAAVGLPCLLTRQADPLGRLSAEGAALRVEPDVASIATGLHRLAAMEVAELRAMGSRARTIVRSEFTWERTAALLTDAYERYCLTPRG